MRDKEKFGSFLEFNVNLGELHGHEGVSVMGIQGQKYMGKLQVLT